MRYIYQFYANALPLFTTYNKFLQWSDQLAHKVASTTGDLKHKIGKRFLQSGISYESIDESDIDDESRWLPLDETFVGLRVSRLIHGLLEKGMITDILSMVLHNSSLIMQILMWQLSNGA